MFIDGRKNQSNLITTIFFIFAISFSIFCIGDALLQKIKGQPKKNNHKIRLIVFDMGDTLWTEIHEDKRAIPRTDRYFYMIDENHMYFRPNISLELFPGVRKLFRSLYQKGFYVSICSINDNEASQWIEKDLFNLNIDGFIKHSRIGYQGSNAHVKGKWMFEIIQEWNQNETKQKPIQCHEILFVDDDNPSNHEAVKLNCSDINCIYPITLKKNNKTVSIHHYNKETMLKILNFI